MAGSRPVAEGLQRRVVLAGGLSLSGLTVLGLAGCTNPFGRDDEAVASAATRSAEQQAVERARGRARDLRTTSAALAADPTQSDRVRALMLDVTSDHDDQLAALGSPSSSASPTATSPAPGATPEAGTGTSQQDAEWASAVEAFTDGRTLPNGALALLLVRLAAANAVHADLSATATEVRPPGALSAATAARAVSTTVPSASTSTAASASAPATPSVTPAGSASPTPSPGSQFASPTEQALNRQLAGEHAAVYAYPLVIARTTGKRRALAKRLWAEHRSRREVLVTRLLSAGVAPVPSQAGYVVDPLPSTADEAVTLAAKIERALATLAADVVATAPVGADRDDGAEQLVLAARRTAQWSGRTEALPGQRRTATGSAGPSATSTGATGSGAASTGPASTGAATSGAPGLTAPTGTP